MNFKLTNAQMNEIDLALLDRIEDLKGRLASFEKSNDENLIQVTKERLKNAIEASEIIVKQRGERPCLMIGLVIC